MNTLFDARSRASQPLRVAVIAASLAVIGCFSAAATFAGQPAQAETVQVAQR